MRNTYRTQSGETVYTYTAEYSEQVAQIAEEVSQVCTLSASQVSVMLSAYIGAMIGKNPPHVSNDLGVGVDIQEEPPCR